MAIRLDVFDDFHLHGASSPAWEQRYVQLSPGLMRSALIETAAPGLHVSRTWMSARVAQQGCLPASASAVRRRPMSWRPAIAWWRRPATCRLTSTRCAGGCAPATPAADLNLSQAAGGAGFEHPGHFGMRYRDLFGELPSQTFRKTASP